MQNSEIFLLFFFVALLWHWQLKAFGQYQLILFITIVRRFCDRLSKQTT